jgi:hypothetical protein
MPTKFGDSVRGQKENIRTAFTALVSRLEVVEKAFNKNTRVFHEAIQMLEAQQEVLRRVMQALFSGKVVLVETASGQRIDWNKYLKEYIEELVESEAKKDAKAGPGSVLATADEDAPIIFGGDQT